MERYAVVNSKMDLLMAMEIETIQNVGILLENLKIINIMELVNMNLLIVINSKENLKMGCFMVLVKRFLKMG